MSSRTVKKKTRRVQRRATGDAYAAGWKNGARHLMSNAIGGLIGALVAIAHKEEIPIEEMLEDLERFIDTVRKNPGAMNAFVQEAETKTKRIANTHTRRDVQ